MTSRAVGLVLTIALLAGCSGASFGPPASSGASFAAGGPALLQPAIKARHYVYWTPFAGCTYQQIQFARAPLKATSKAKGLYCGSGKGLAYSSGLHVDPSGRLWVIAFGKYSGDPGSAQVFKLPLKETSNPELTFVLSGTNDPDHLTFDSSGNLWVSSHNLGITEYAGPFTKSGTLSPALTLTNGITAPAGLALDKHDNLYVSNFGGTADTSIAVFTKPIGKSPTYYLKGLTKPGGLIFDKAGDLYASINGPSQFSIVRYNAVGLGSGDTPNIIDSTGLSTSYESDFAISNTGDLYFANCGSTGSIYVYPTSKKPFSSSLAPSLDYTNSNLQQAGCAWGIAIK
ncbi:MAG: hypothetical protein JO190_04405 [Candidatus Eremiobacteraeota bacterium]|nr:hypothetical protein [Candidatus Eremiobacteraeota bacterium]MBV8497924.1 hypothetical protein [Candidatus Eremiobacteraeota bacterium]